MEEARIESERKNEAEREATTIDAAWMKRHGLDVKAVPDAVKSGHLPSWKTLVKEIYLEDDAAYDTIESLRTVIPGFMQGITQANCNQITLGELAETWLPEVEAWVSGRGGAPKRATVAIPQHQAQSGGVTQRGVLHRLVEASPDAQYLISTMGDVSDWDAKRFTQAWSVVQSINSRLDPVVRMGVMSDVTEESLVAWQQVNQKKVLPVGPYLLMKYLAQSGVRYTYYEDHVSGAWMKWSRNGIEVASNDRRAIMLDTGNDVEGPIGDGMWRTFLDDINIQKKQLVFKDISQEAYSAGDLLMNFWKVTPTGSSKKMAMELIPQPNITDKAVIDYVTAIKARLIGRTLYSNDADWIVETIAMVVNDDLPMPDNVRKYLEKRRSELEDRMESLDVSFKSAHGQVSSVKEAMFAKLGVPSDLVVAQERLKSDRQKRNTCPAAQYITKNCASVGGDNMPQYLDTMVKGYRLVRIMELLGAPMNDPKTNVHVYGVAYGHMNAAFATTKASYTYYDTAKADRSVADYDYGDVFDSNGEYIVDDTLVTTGKNGKPCAGADTPDLSKMRHHLDNPHLKVGVFKVSAFSLGSQEKYTAFMNLIGKQSRFHYVQLVKAGKLHNAEMFVLLSRAEKLGPRSKLTTDAKAIAQCMVLSNMLITDAHRKGIRLRGKKGKPLSAFWRSMVAALSAAWPWYDSVVGPKTPYTGGKVYQSLNLGMDDDADEVDQFAVAATHRA